MRPSALIPMAAVALAACTGVAGPPAGSSSGDLDEDEDDAAAADDDDDGNTSTDASEVGTAGPTPTEDDSEATGDPGPATTGAAESSSTSGASAPAEETASPEDDSGSAACADLEACCDEIGADLYAGCITVVDMGSPDLCDSILGTYHTEGYCTGEPHCDDLGDCCPELPPGVGWQDTCEYYADLGNQPQCLMLIGDYQLSDYCL